MAIDDNTSYELTGYQVKDLAGRIRRKADASSVPTSISDLGQVTASDIDWSTMPGSYSTTEQRTPFTWVDGKPIYKKTVSIGALPNATSKSIAHGISNLDNIIDASGFAKETGGVRITLPFASVANVVDQVAMRFEAANIVVITGANRSGFSGYVTLWYTKTTD